MMDEGTAYEQGLVDGAKHAQKLIEELKKYAGHKEECESTYQTLDGVVELDFGCTCGLDDLLKEK